MVRGVRSARKRFPFPPPPCAAPRFHDDHEKQDESRAERLIILSLAARSRASEPCLAEPRMALLQDEGAPCDQGRGAARDRSLPSAGGRACSTLEFQQFGAVTFARGP